MKETVYTRNTMMAEIVEKMNCSEVVETMMMMITENGEVQRQTMKATTQMLPIGRSSVVIRKNNIHDYEA